MFYVPTGSSVTDIYKVEKHNVSFKSGKLFDLSELPFFSGYEDLFYEWV